VIAFDDRGLPRARIDVPTLRPTSIAFGGPKLQTMYLTSARMGLTPSDLATWPALGALFALERPVSDRPANVFGGTPTR
jgi:sugar lactone lactonase YvrE